MLIVILGILLALLFIARAIRKLINTPLQWGRRTSRSIDGTECVRDIIFGAIFIIFVLGVYFA